jgi:LuxR family quorum-sensing system transcriptional regulator SolR
MSGLDPTNISALHFNENIAEIVENICNPLNNYLGITHFGYVKIFNDGSMLRIANKPEWTRKYFEKSFYNDIDFYGMRHVPENGTRTSLLTGTPITEHSLIICRDYNIWNSLIIYKKFLDYGDVWYFGTTRDNTEILNYYMNNIDIFKNFIVYFKNKLSDIIEPYEPTKLIVSKIKLQKYANDDEKTRQLLHTLKIKSYHLKDDIYLSQREKECLSHLSTGKTMKEIARIINISPRTVESYINTIKKKTGFNTKSNLIKMFYGATNYL